MLVTGPGEVARGRPSVAGMTSSLDLTGLRVQLVLVDSDIAAAEASLDAAATAGWVSTSADLFRGELSEARRRLVALTTCADLLRTALLRLAP